MSVQIDDLAASMIAAARDTVGERWPQMQAVAEEQFRNLASSLDSVGRLLAEGKIDASRARKHAHIHQLAARSILTTVEGLGLLTAEHAIHAAVRSVAKVINTTAKFALL